MEDGMTPTVKQILTNKLEMIERTIKSHDVEIIDYIRSIEATLAAKASHVAARDDIIKELLNA